MERSVFILWHVHSVRGEDDEKLIGVYASREDAQGAIARVGSQPGFRSTPEGFHIDEYEIGADQWKEGFITT